MCCITLLTCQFSSFSVQFGSLRFNSIVDAHIHTQHTQYVCVLCVQRYMPSNKFRSIWIDESFAMWHCRDLVAHVLPFLNHVVCSNTYQRTHIHWYLMSQTIKCSTYAIICTDCIYIVRLNLQSNATVCHIRFIAMIILSIFIKSHFLFSFFVFFSSELPRIGIECENQIYKQQNGNIETKLTFIFLEMRQNWG